MAKAPAASKPSTARVRDDQWRIPDLLWERIEPLLPARPAHPLGCHNPRVLDRKAMDAIFFVLRTGCQWNALNATGICSSIVSPVQYFLQLKETGPEHPGGWSREVSGTA